jgi:hypothetical protein
MKKTEIIALTAAGAFAAVTVFHIIHYTLYCRYKGVPEKSHCSVCGHRQICQKYHQKKN